MNQPTLFTDSINSFFNEFHRSSESVRLFDETKSPRKKNETNSSVECDSGR